MGLNSRGWRRPVFRCPCVGILVAALAAAISTRITVVTSSMVRGGYLGGRVGTAHASFSDGGCAECVVPKSDLFHQRFIGARRVLRHHIGVILFKFEDDRSEPVVSCKCLLEVCDLVVLGDWRSPAGQVRVDNASPVSGGALITEDYKIAYLEEALTGNDRFATVILKFKEDHPNVVAQDPTRTYEALMEKITLRHNALGTSTIGEAGMGRANAATKIPTQGQRNTGRRQPREFKPTKYCWTHSTTGYASSNPRRPQ